MTDHKITPDAPVLVAIDIAKHRHEILIEVPGRKRRRRLTIQNTREDYQRVITLLVDYGRPVRIAFEATGNYHSEPPLVYRRLITSFHATISSLFNCA